MTGYAGLSVDGIEALTIEVASYFVTDSSTFICGYIGGIHNSACEAGFATWFCDGFWNFIAEFAADQEVFQVTCSSVHNLDVSIFDASFLSIE